MRVDAARARTWLFAALALWALVVWALGLVGLGSRIERLPDDPALLQPLPRAAPAVADRLAPLPQYAAIGDRPLFTSDRRPQPFFINPAGQDEVQDSVEYILTSVLLSPGLEMAILHPAAGEGEPVRLRVGEAPEGAPGWRLASISPRGAVFEGPEGRRELELRVYDGIGGEPPTPLVVTPPTATPSAPAPRARPATATGRAAPPLAPPPPRQQGAAAAPAVADLQPGDAAGEMDGDGAVDTSESQVEAIRQRIEARRAQQRQQARQPPQPAPAENP